MADSRNPSYLYNKQWDECKHEWKPNHQPYELGGNRTENEVIAYNIKAKYNGDKN